MSEDVSPKPSQPEPIYLGDGVYASYDGFQIWLAVNHHEHKVVALDQETMSALIDYAKKVYHWS